MWSNILCRHLTGVALRVSVTVTAAAVLAVAGALIGDTASAKDSEVRVELSEFVIGTDVASVITDEITFTVNNIGTTEHELIVVRTDLMHDALPLLEGGTTVDESQLDIVAETEPFAAGDIQTISVALEPGSYALICNIAGHYVLGMSAPFTVIEPPVEERPTIEETRVEIYEPTAPAETHSNEGGGGLPTGAWVGLVLMFGLAGILIMGSLPYVLPKPPGANDSH